MVHVDALLNWVWQGILPALALSVFARLCGPALDAKRRYRLWWLTLAAILAAPVLSVLVGSAFTGRDASTTAAPVALPAGAEASTPLVIAIWALFSVVAVLRVVVALGQVRRAQRSCSPFPVERASKLRHWNTVREGSITRLALSKDVRSAAVLGVRSPVIAVNPQVVLALDDEELDQIVVHEWAHVERHDHCLNALEHFILAVFGIHPAIWWVGRQLRLEREVACDDRVVSIVGSRKRYAACLLKLRTLAGPGADALPAPAALSTSQLTTRIHRLLDGPRQSSARRFRLAGSLGAAIVVATTGVVAPLELVGRVDPPAEPIANILPVATLLVGSPADEARVALEGRSNELPTPSSSPAGAAANLQATGGQVRAAAQTVPPAAQPAAAPSVTAALVSTGALHAPSRESTIDIEPLGRLELASTAVALPTAPAGDDTSQAKQVQTPWGAAADTGVAVGRGSQKAAVATAGFFKRVSKSIADAFVPGEGNDRK